MSLKILDTVAVKLHIDPTTHEEARKIYSQAFPLMRPGSNHHFRHSLNALAAICVFISSSRIGKTNITSGQAQASCAMDPKTFRIAQSMVEQALSSMNIIDMEKSVSFQALLSRYGVDGDRMVPMVEVRDHLQPAKKINSDMYCVIFYWVCSEVFKMDAPTRQTIQTDFRISQRSWTNAWNILELQCGELKKQQIKLAEANASYNRKRLTNKPTKSPTGTELMKRKAAASTPSQESPLKRRKSASSQCEADGTDSLPKRDTKSKASTCQPNAAITTKPIPGDDDSSDDASKEVILITPSRTLRKTPDFSAWTASKPPAEASKQGRSEKQARETPKTNTNINVFTETPTTSTGRSDASSLGLSTPISRKRPAQSIKAIDICSSLHFEEESRRQRRGLRAPFLDPTLYTWKPDMSIVHKMKHAQKLENKLVASHGDPWDDL